MTYGNREVQPELFSKTKKEQKQNLLKNNLFGLAYKSAISFSLDTLIVIIIGMMMVNLSAFVLGIERGKILAKNEQIKVKVIEPAVVDAELPLVAPIPLAIEEEKKVITSTVEKKQIVNNDSKPADGYIIQLVTYSSDAYANNEVNRLTAQGLDGHVLKSGSFYIVYSGTYNSKVKANEKLASFKQRYKDCFVKKILN